MHKFAGIICCSIMLMPVVLQAEVISPIRTYSPTSVDQKNNQSPLWPLVTPQNLKVESTLQRNVLIKGSFELKNDSPFDSSVTRYEVSTVSYEPIGGVKTSTTKNATPAGTFERVYATQTYDSVFISSGKTRTINFVYQTPRMLQDTGNLALRVTVYTGSTIVTGAIEKPVHFSDTFGRIPLEIRSATLVVGGKVFDKDQTSIFSTSSLPTLSLSVLNNNKNTITIQDSVRVIGGVGVENTSVLKKNNVALATSTNNLYLKLVDKDTLAGLPDGSYRAIFSFIDRDTLAVSEEKSFTFLKGERLPLLTFVSADKDSVRVGDTLKVDVGVLQPSMVAGQKTATLQGTKVILRILNAKSKEIASGSQTIDTSADKTLRGGMVVTMTLPIRVAAVKLFADVSLEKDGHILINRRFALSDPGDTSTIPLGDSFMSLPIIFSLIAVIILLVLLIVFRKKVSTIFSGLRAYISSKKSASVLPPKNLKNQGKVSMSALFGLLLLSVFALLFFVSKSSVFAYAGTGQYITMPQDATLTENAKNTIYSLCDTLLANMKIGTHSGREFNVYSTSTPGPISYGDNVLYDDSSRENPGFEWDSDGNRYPKPNYFYFMLGTGYQRYIDGSLTYDGWYSSFYNSYAISRYSIPSGILDDSNAGMNYLAIASPQFSDTNYDIPRNIIDGTFIPGKTYNVSYQMTGSFFDKRAVRRSECGSPYNNIIDYYEDSNEIPATNYAVKTVISKIRNGVWTSTSTDTYTEASNRMNLTGLVVPNEPYMVTTCGGSYYPPDDWGTTYGTGYSNCWDTASDVPSPGYHYGVYVKSNVYEPLTDLQCYYEPVEPPSTSPGVAYTGTWKVMTNFNDPNDFPGNEPWAFDGGSVNGSGFLYTYKWDSADFPFSENAPGYPYDYNQMDMFFPATYATSGQKTMSLSLRNVYGMSETYQCTPYEPISTSTVNFYSNKCDALLTTLKQNVSNNFDTNTEYSISSTDSTDTAAPIVTYTKPLIAQASIATTTVPVSFIGSFGATTGSGLTWMSKLEVDGISGGVWSKAYSEINQSRGFTSNGFTAPSKPYVVSACSGFSDLASSTPYGFTNTVHFYKPLTTATCSPSVTSVNKNVPVTWTLNTNEKSGTYYLYWHGHSFVDEYATSTNETTNTVTASYADIGRNFMYVTISTEPEGGGQSLEIECNSPVDVGQVCEEGLYQCPNSTRCVADPDECVCPAGKTQKLCPVQGLICVDNDTCPQNTSFHVTLKSDSGYLRASENRKATCDLTLKTDMAADCTLATDASVALSTTSVTSNSSPITIQAQNLASTTRVTATCTSQEESPRTETTSATCDVLYSVKEF